jgi:[ribosomal protein S18]-alanine N-acetyltransferase
MAAPHQIGLAKPSDTSAIELLSREIVKPDRVRAWCETVTLAMASADANVAVARAGETLIGLGVMEYTDGEALLALLAVTPTKQRQGVGGALLAWLEATAFVAGIRSISVQLRREDPVSRRFYRTAGYRREFIDRRTYWKSLDEVRLKWWHSRWAPKK